MKSISALITLALLSGCAMRGPLSRVAVEQNTLVARTTDEMMLTNILRAREREPMHFTSVSALHGNLSLTGEADLTLAAPTQASEIDRDATGAMSGAKLTSAANTFTPALKGTVSTNPSFDVAVNDSQAFYQGFLAPIKVSIVAHFLDDDWPADLLTYLFVSRFDFVTKQTVFVDGKVASESEDEDSDSGRALLEAASNVHQGIAFQKGDIVQSLKSNADPSDKDFVKFKSFSACYNLHATKVTTDDIEMFPVTSASDLSKFDASQYEVRKSSDGTTFSLYKKGTTSDGLDLVLTSNPQPANLPPGTVCPKNTVSPQKPDNPKSTEIANEERRLGFLLEGTRSRVRVKKSSKEDFRIFQGHGTYELKLDSVAQPVTINVNISATIRSTEALLYFLGEYVRYDSDAKFQTILGSQPAGSRCDAGRPYDILRVKSEKPEKSVLSASLHGKTWWIPDNSVECNGRSMKIIAFIEQLYNLQKSSSDKVGTQSIRLLQ